MHPSLRAKKYDESQDLWQARVTKDWRSTSLFRMTTITLWTSSRIRSEIYAPCVMLRFLL